MREATIAMQYRSMCVFNLFANILNHTRTACILFFSIFFFLSSLPFFVLRNPLYVDINFIAMDAFNDIHSVRSSIMEIVCNFN